MGLFEMLRTWNPKPAPTALSGMLPPPGLAAAELAESRPTPASETPAAPAPASHGPSWSGVRTVAATNRSRNLTPERLASYLRQAADGDPRAQSELFTEMEDRDLQLVSLLGTRKRSVAGLPWHVQPVSDRRTDKKIAAFVEETLKGITNFEDAMVGVLDALTKGFGAAEIDWRQAPGRVWIEQFLVRPASWFVPDRDDPAQWRILDDADPYRGQALEPGRWVFHEARAKAGDTAAGSALGRPVAWAYLFKNYSLKDWVIFAEIYGSPIRIGKYGPGASETDRNELYSALMQLGVDAAAIFPEGTSIELIDAKRGTSVDVYARLIEWCDRAYAKAILGQTLTSEQGSSGGSLAMAQVHDKVRQDLVESDARQLAATLNRDLVRPLVVHQFGPQAAYPCFEFETEPPEDLLQTAKLYSELKGLGVSFPRAHVHERFGVPMAADGEETYGGAGASSPPAAKNAPGKPAPKLAAASHVCLGCGGVRSDEPRHVALADPGTLPPMPAEVERAMREALASGGYEGWERTLRHLREWLGRARDPGEVSARLVQALETLNIEPLGGHIADEILRGELIGRAQVNAGEIPVGEWPALPPREASAFWEQKTAMLPSQFASLSYETRSRGFTIAQFTTLQAVQEIHTAAEQILAEGLTQADFEDRYEETLKRHGMADDQPWHVENVFRTNIGTAVQAGRYRQQTRPDTLQRRPFWEYDAVLDGRERPSHGAMDGKVWPADHAIWQAWYPPNGFMCRCGVRSCSAVEVAERGLRIVTEMPTIRMLRQDGTLGPLEPNVPDSGFRRNPALEPHEFDFSRFSPQYRRALGLEAA